MSYHLIISKLKSPFFDDADMSIFSKYEITYLRLCTAGPVACWFSVFEIIYGPTPFIVIKNISYDDEMFFTLKSKVITLSDNALTLNKPPSVHAIVSTYMHITEEVTWAARKYRNQFKE